MGKITFGVIGFGHIGKKHALMVSGNAESELKAVVDTDAEKLNQAKELYPNIQVFESIEDLIEANLDLNVVNVCTPNGLHADHSLKAIEFGKHVVIEKPMALSKKDCENVISKALNKNKKREANASRFLLYTFYILNNKYHYLV